MARSSAARVAPALDSWAAHDRAIAITDADREAIVASEAARAHLVERALESPSTKDFFDAAAIYGRTLATSGASPSFGAQAIDTLTMALGGPQPSWAGGARAALAEGYAKARAEAAHRALVDAWAPPHCVIRIDDDTAAIATSFPSDDPEDVGPWAERVAHGLARADVRHVILGGDAPVALREALEVAGITVRAVETRRRSWFPWKR